MERGSASASLWFVCGFPHPDNDNDNDDNNGGSLCPKPQEGLYFTPYIAINCIYNIHNNIDFPSSTPKRYNTSFVVHYRVTLPSWCDYVSRNE